MLARRIDPRGKYGFGAKAVLPVVHMLHAEQVLHQVDIIADTGARGVFVIGCGHTSAAQEICAAESAKEFHPELFVGINILSLDAATAYYSVMDSGLDGVWTDDAGIREDGLNKTAADMEMVLTVAPPDRPIYFGGTAFKYGARIENLELAAQRARGRMDVITTSGDGTGYAPAKEKIDAMRKGAKDTPLAIASGITPENIGDYDADVFLVATGISKDFYSVDPDKLRAVLDAVDDG